MTPDPPKATVSPLRIISYLWVIALDKLHLILAFTDSHAPYAVPINAQPPLGLSRAILFIQNVLLKITIILLALNHILALAVTEIHRLYYGDDALPKSDLPCQVRFAFAPLSADLQDSQSLLSNHSSAQPVTSNPAPHESHAPLEVAHAEAVPEISTLLQWIATALLERYLKERRSMDLSVSIDVFQVAKELRPRSHLHRWDTLNNLAIAIFIRYKEGHKESDLSKAIALRGEALRLRRPDWSDRSPSLSHPENAASTRLVRHGKDLCLSDLAPYIQLPGHPSRSQNEKPRPSGSSPSNRQHRWAPDTADFLNSEGISCIKLYQREGGHAILSKSIQLFQRAILLLPPGHPNRPTSLTNLAGATFARYRRDGAKQDLSEAIRLHREALSSRSSGRPDRSELLSNLAIAVITQYERDGAQQDLSEAIHLFRGALSFRPSGDPARSTSLSNLARAILERYEQRGENRDLSEALQLHSEALSSQPSGHPDRSSSLNNLANAVLTRYERDGAGRDLSEAIQLHREALSSQPSGHPARSGSLSNLASAILERYERDEGQQDLSEVIHLLSEALSFQPPSHPNRSTTLGILASAIFTRYWRDRVERDLSETIQLHREALSFQPSGHPARSGSLNSLSGAVLTRYARYGEKQDLSEAIQLLREALAPFPLGNPTRASSLKNLSTAILTRHMCDGEERDLLEAIRLLREALSLFPPGHPNRSTSLSDLASAIQTLYKCGAGDQNLCLIEEIIQLLRDATATKTSPTPARLQAALQWIDIAIENDSKSAQEAYQSALTHLGSALALDRSLQARHTNLLSQSTHSQQTKGLALGAARWVLTNRSNGPKLAIEFLDQGRNVLLASVGQFRADLSDVRRKDPALADEFYRVSRVLDSATLTGQEISEGKSSHEDPTSRYKRVSADWDAIITKIRLLPDCESFLLPVPYIMLQEAAMNGPVIVIVVGHGWSVAIIVLPKGEPHTVDLPKASEETLKRLYEEMEDAVGMLSNPRRADQKLASMLLELWSIMVQPVVHGLREKLHVPFGSRIWWYPTSWASFLPLHAAGSYKKGGSNVADLYVSSYTPTLQALRRARSRVTLPSESNTRLLVVAQAETPGQVELVCVKKEVEMIRRVAPDLSLLVGAEGTKERVLQELRDHSWVHLACHGHPDSADPFKSQFALHDGPLSLQDIITNDLPSAEFAYLSACHSAAQDRALPDEGLALASGMQFAGFKSVVGTLWAMADEDAPTLARVFYREVKRRSGEGKAFDCRTTAEALHEAVRKLREKKVPLFRWVNLVHYGI